MQLREHVYSLLTDTSIITAVPGGIHARGSFATTPEERPFIVYVFGSQPVEPKWGNGALPRRLTLWVYVHDDVGDYLRIDSTLDLVEQVLEAAPTSADGSGFMECTAVDRSIDLEDDGLNTFYRYARFQVVSSK